MIEMIYLLLFGIVPMTFLIATWLPKWKNWIILIGSIIAWFTLKPMYAFVVLFFLLFTYGMTLAMHRIRIDRRKKDLYFMIELIGLFLILDLLWSFNFALDSVINSFVFLVLILTALEYIFEVYREKREPIRSLDCYGVYLISFPRMFLSRMISYDIFQKETKKVTWEDWKQGLMFIFLGLSRVMLLGVVGIHIVDEVVVHIEEQTILFLLLMLPLFALSCFHIWMGFRHISDGLWMMIGMELKKEANPMKYTGDLRKFLISLYPSLFTKLPLPNEKKWSRMYASALAGVMMFLCFLVRPTFLSLWVGALFGIFLSLETVPWVKERSNFERSTCYIVVGSLVMLLLSSRGDIYLQALSFQKGIPFVGTSTLYQLGQYGIFFILSIISVIPSKPHKRKSPFRQKVWELMRTFGCLILFLILVAHMI